jgi:hypothetical protein
MSNASNKRFFAESGGSARLSSHPPVLLKTLTIRPMECQQCAMSGHPDTLTKKHYLACR